MYLGFGMVTLLILVFGDGNVECSEQNSTLNHGSYMISKMTKSKVECVDACLRERRCSGINLLKNTTAESRQDLVCVVVMATQNASSVVKNETQPIDLNGLTILESSTVNQLRNQYMKTPCTDCHSLQHCVEDTKACGGHVCKCREGRLDIGDGQCSHQACKLSSEKETGEFEVCPDVNKTMSDCYILVGANESRNSSNVTFILGSVDTYGVPNYCQHAAQWIGIRPITQDGASTYCGRLRDQHIEFSTVPLLVRVHLGRLPLRCIKFTLKEGDDVQINAATL